MKLLLIGDERRNRRLFAWGFAMAPCSVKLASNWPAIETALNSETFHVVCLDLRMQEADALDILQRLGERLSDLPVVALVGECDRRAMPARLPGVSAQLSSPFSIESLHAALRESARVEPVGLARPKEAPSAPAVAAAGSLSANDEAAERTHQLAVRAANSSAAILLLGETGTGKTLLAQTIHHHSPIRQKPFVTVNCPCLNHELLESDLFGHVRGAFTGAVQDTWGKVAAAEGGTLFLDEIGDLPMSLQPKLLRLLQEKQYERVGEAASRSANVRIIAATNRDLKREVALGRFREDLFYRLNVIAIDLPPLRSRPAQIMGAAEVMLATICQQLGKTLPSFTVEARRLLENYPWPGNLRELRNMIERAAILSSGPVLETSDFPALLSHVPTARCQIGSAISLQALENAHIQMVVASSASLEEAARILEIDKSTLYRKRKLMESRVAKFAPMLESAVAAG